MSLEKPTQETPALEHRSRFANSIRLVYWDTDVSRASS